MRHCMVVDDSSVIRKVARRILEDLEFETSEAEDGAQALARCRARMPDVILLDCSMPVMDGFEATRLIRAERANACVLMLSGSNSTSDVDAARRAGAAAYVTKDRVGNELIEAIFELASR